MPVLPSGQVTPPFRIGRAAGRRTPSIASRTVDHLEHCDALEGEIALFADVLLDADDERPVASCPEWSILDLVEHLGRVHRWAEDLVRKLAQTRIPAPELPGDLGPVDSTWIREGGVRLVTALRRTDPNLDMWAWGADQHVRFWSRRQLHETLIHRIDLQLAMDLQSHVDEQIAADGIDEFLVNLPAAATFSPRIEELRSVSGRLAFSDSRTGRRWTVQSDASGAKLVGDEDPVDVEFTADGLDLLLSLYRRRALGDIAGVIEGDQSLLQFWLDHSALE
jgi:uncharacterized protein (TIGR03083 family)